MKSVSIRLANPGEKESALLIRVKDICGGVELNTRADLPKLKVIVTKDNGEKIVTFVGGEK